MAVAAESWLSMSGSGVVASFLKTEGVPAPVIREVEVVRRRGINNVGHYLGGLVGQEFRLTTWSDAANLAAAKTLQAGWRALENTEASLYWQGVLVGSVYIYEAAPQVVNQFAVGVGGFNNGGAMAVSVWRMRGLA